MTTKKPTLRDVLKAAIPSSAGITDYATRRVLDGLTAAVRMLADALDGRGRYSGLSVPPDTRIEAGPGMRVMSSARNAFTVAAIPPPVTEVGDSDAIMAEKDFPFRFTKTSATGGSIYAGKCYIKGVLTTITSLPSSLSSVTTSTKYWVVTDIDDSTATWSSGAAYPSSTATDVVWPILEITCDDGVITTWVHRQMADIHAEPSGSALPNGTNKGDLLYWKADTSEWAVASITGLANNDIIALKWDDTNKTYVKQAVTTQAVVTNVTYSSSTYKLEQVKKTLTVLASDSEATSTVTTAVEES